MDPGIESFGGLRVDGPLAHDAPERLLDMGAGAGESVIEIEMAEGGIKVVAPEQADDPTAEPDAFWAAGGTGDQAGGFGEFIRAALAVFARLTGGAGRRLCVTCLGVGGQHS